MTENIQAKAEECRAAVARLRDEVGKVIVGHREIVDGVITCLFVGGHCLLEGVPGLGKTLLVRTLAQALELRFSRIQFTPDLMPADVIGTNMVMEDQNGRRHFEFQHGPVFGNIILADEINRATPKTQSALLEAMQERSVTVGGVRHELEAPFFVLATQNPLEMEGTYPLPEAQLDRFMFKLLVRYSNLEELIEIADRTTARQDYEPAKVLEGPEILEWQKLVRQVIIAPHVKDYAGRLVLATHPQGEYAVEITNRYVRYGSSPRGLQSIILAGKMRAMLAGRYNVSYEDVRESVLPALRHRLILNFEGEAEGVSADDILRQILEEVPKESSQRKQAK
ncbi:MAG TPA: MoxR family ATPase [Planctomycetota bacterium]|nr:MoxR family ATPase [Planctomycetota bacterium]